MIFLGWAGAGRAFAGKAAGPASKDAGKKIKEHKRRFVVDIERFPIKFTVHKASVQDRERVSALVLGMLEKVPYVKKIRVDGTSGPVADGCVCGSPTRTHP